MTVLDWIKVRTMMMWCSNVALSRAIIINYVAIS